MFFASATTRVLAGRGNDVVLAAGRVSGGPGNDRIRAAAGARSRLSGGRGADRITGSRRADLIDPGPGIDRVSGRGGGDVITTRDGFIDIPECGGRGSALIDALDDYPARCTRVRRRGVARVLPAGATFSERGSPPRFGFRVDLLCPRDGPRECRGTVAVESGGVGLLRKPFVLARRHTRGSVRFSITEEQARSLGGRVRLIVRSRDRSGRRRTAAGVFKAELDFAG